MELENIFQPHTIRDACEALSKFKNAKVLAGGTDLLIDLKNEQIHPTYLVDLDKIHDLKNIMEKEDTVTLGSMVTFSDLQENQVIKKYYPSLIDCANSMGSPQIRNMATIGGNIVNASASADIIPCIICLDGTFVFESIEGIREIRSQDYFEHYIEQQIKENEILKMIILPKKYSKNGFYKLGKRNALAISRVSVAISIMIENNIIKDCSICLGAVGRFPFRVQELERASIGKNMEWLSSSEPLSIIEERVYQSIKTRSSMTYKKEAVKGVYKQVIRNLELECVQSDSDN